MMTPRTRTIALGLIGAAILAYLGALAVIYADQRYLVYRNKAGAEAPGIPGLPITDVRIATPDGQRLEAWYEPPRPGRPVFLFLHGKGTNLAAGTSRYIRMHKEGVGYLALAYRGFSGSTGAPSEKGLLIDGLAAYDWLRAKGFADRDIVLHGHSLGTGVATYVATQRPARALILEAPFTSTTDVAQDRYPFVPAALLLRDRFANRSRIKDVHMPVLIVHGTADATIPFPEGQKLYGLANAPKVFVVMPGSGHNTLVCDGLYDHVWPFLGLAKVDADPAPALTPDPYCH
jgi:fermentation-respiration switch protein FrsA (DUF1100 family)